jgi:hypothetical protein
VENNNAERPVSVAASTQLAEIKDANGTSVQSYTEAFVEKCIEVGLNVVVLLAAPPDKLHMMTNIPQAVVPDALNQYASLMRKEALYVRKRAAVAPEFDPAKMN